MMIQDLDTKIAQVVQTLAHPRLVQEVFNTFLKSYPKDWKKLKVSYSKIQKSHRAGRSIPPPKPEVWLKKSIQIWLSKNNE